MSSFFNWWVIFLPCLLSTCGIYYFASLVVDHLDLLKWDEWSPYFLADSSSSSFLYTPPQFPTLLPKEDFPVLDSWNFLFLGFAKSGQNSQKSSKVLLRVEICSKFLYPEFQKVNKLCQKSTTIYKKVQKIFALLYSRSAPL